MSSLIIAGDTSGTLTLAAPAVAGSNTLTLQAGTATNSMNTLATAVASTSGTSIDFTGLPAWVKRITVMLNGVSTNGTSIEILQIGSGSFTTTGYSSTAGYFVNGAASVGSGQTTGFALNSTNSAAVSIISSAVLTLVSGNTWLMAYSGFAAGGSAAVLGGGGTLTLGGALDRVRITTVNGTDTFDAGSVNILYEG
jgi:hypothetical protein